MRGLARGTRDAAGVWHPDQPADYPPLDIHGVLPWSTLDQSSGAWQARKRWWKARIGEDLTVRGHATGMIHTGRHAAISSGISAFDPVLAELCITWYSPTGGVILDPYAGGPVRGYVADHLQRTYLGIDLTPAQVAANQHVHPDLAHLWTHGDGPAELGSHVDHADYILTCPPYHNRERYSDHPDDLSAMTWTGYQAAVDACMAACWGALHRDRFMTWVVSDVRDHRGHLRALPAMVDTAARKTGFVLCNEQILISPAGTRAKTMRPAWEACRTTTRRHQIVLTWVKGDRRVATREVRGC